IDAILAGGASAALHVSQNRSAGLDTRGRLNSAGHTGGMAYALGIHDDMMLLSPLAVLNDIIDDLLLVIVIVLRQKDILGSVCDTAPESDIASIAAHNLDDAAAL